MTYNIKVFRNENLIQTALIKIYVYVLDLKFKDLNNLRDDQEFTSTSGTDFLDIVKLLLTILFAFDYLWNYSCQIERSPWLCLEY